LVVLVVLVVVVVVLSIGHELLYFRYLKYSPVLSFAVLVQHSLSSHELDSFKSWIVTLAIVVVVVLSIGHKLLYFRYLKYIPVLSFTVLVQHSLSSNELDSFKSWIVTLAIVPYQLLSTLVISTVRRCP
jgi:branched-subunit amino acid transport protein